MGALHADLRADDRAQPRLARQFPEAGGGAEVVHVRHREMAVAHLGRGGNEPLGRHAPANGRKPAANVQGRYCKIVRHTQISDFRFQASDRRPVPHDAGRASMGPIGPIRPMDLCHRMRNVAPVQVSGSRFRRCFSGFHVPDSQFRCFFSEFHVPDSQFRCFFSGFHVPGSRFRRFFSGFHVPGSVGCFSRLPATGYQPPATISLRTACGG